MINDTETDSTQDIDIVMPMYHLIEYTDNFSITTGNLWHYYKDKPNANLADSKSFKSKVKMTESTRAGGNTKDVEIFVPLKYFSNFWGTPEMSLINCEVSLCLTWSSTCVIINSTSEARFTITDTKRFVAVVNLSTQDNEKFLQQ